jgi:ketosteroid isomerase-like protein
MVETQLRNIEDGERRPFAARGEALVATAGAMALMKGVYEPGWRWSVDVKPLAGHDLCQTHHLGFVLSGQMHVQMADGTEYTARPGDLFDLPAGHDAWVLGDEPFVMVDVSSEVMRYARGRDTSIHAPDDEYMMLVRRGYEAFNTGDITTLQEILSHDVAQHVPGKSQIAGEYKGIDAVLAYYGKLGELTDGTFRADLIDVFGDGRGHVTALHQITATRNGITRVSRGTILFTFVGHRATDLVQMHNDLPGDDAFFA